MGILSAVMGNACEVPAKEVAGELVPVLLPDEKVQRAYRIVRDLFIFTDRRLILVDKQGLTGKKVEYQSIPYRSITHFAVETAGSFDLDCELKLHLAGGAIVQKTFGKGVDINTVQKTLASYILR